MTHPPLRDHLRSGLLILAAAIGLVSAAGAATTAAPPDAIETWLTPASMTTMQLSPDGSQVVAVARSGKRSILMLIDAATQTPRALPVRETILDPQSEILWVRWLDDQRLILGVDGEPPMVLTVQGRYLTEVGGFIRPLPRAPGAPCCQLLYWSLPKVLGVLDLVTDTRRRLDVGGSGVPTHLVFDTQGTLRAVSLLQESLFSAPRLVTLWREGAEQPWQEIQVRTGGDIEDAWEPLRMSADQRALVVSSRQGRDTRALFRLDMVRHEPGELMVGHPTVDILHSGFDTVDRDTTLSVITGGMKPETHWFDPRWAALQRAVDAALPDQVNLLSGRPEVRVMVHSLGPTEAGAWYLLDPKTMKMALLGRSHPELDPDVLRPVQVIHHRAPDGLQIPSYLTLPKATGRPVPLVVYVHGGPHARDEWGLDPMAQWLAAQGWAVLQPQFRGSTGFGRAYELAGQNQWGLAMQDDISSGVQHLIGQGLVDPERVCIFGASYGGYAAMWGLASTPQLYRCGISFAGISDLGEWLAEWRDVNLSDASMAWQNRMFGDRATARERLARVAAWRRAADVRAPLLLMHGYRDLRVPVSQSTRMRDALKAAGKTLQWEPFELAGHGFYRREDELRYFHLIQDFLRRHLDAPATAPAASQPSGR